MNPVDTSKLVSSLPARKAPLALASVIAALAIAPSVHAEDVIGDALAKGKTNLEFRYRFENVDQAPMAKQANASTLRTRLRYTSGEFHATSLMLEFDNVSRMGDDRYNDTRNGKGAAPYSYPVVADPDGTDLNQALLKYMGITNTPITVGRQRVNLDNQRWIGSVAWRQNEQTLDGLMLEYKGIDRFTATYGFITRVNRINGPEPGPAASMAEWDSESHLVNLKYVTGEPLSIVGYAYLLDFDPNAVSTSSSQTLGLRLGGAVPVGGFKLGYTGEFAQQSDYGNNTLSFSADYALGELTFGKAPWEVQLGYELLGGDSGAKNAAGVLTPTAVQTPLATLHKFQGWADKFLATPGAGMTDIYAGFTTKFSGIGLTLAAHEYEADTTGVDLGDEINVQIAKTFAKRYTMTLKYADYSSSGVAGTPTDTEKIWVMAEAKF